MSKTDHQLDLVSHLELLEQQTLFNSNALKFSPATLKDLKLALSARNYVNLTWELSHLLWVLAHSDHKASILNFFFVEEAVTSHAAKSWLIQSTFVCPSSHQVTVGAQGVSVQIRDHDFMVNFSRINVLAGLMELLITFNTDFMDVTEAMLGKGLNSIKTLASDMQKSLYDWLEAFMPSARTHKKFTALATHLSDLNYSSIDANFLATWQSLNEIEGFAKIGNFFSSVCSFLASRAEAVKTESLPEYAEDTINSEQTVYAFISSYADESLLQQLPDKPKVISVNQQKKTGVVLEHAAHARRLPWSSLAVMCFSHTQAQLVQALRSNASIQYRQQIMSELDNYVEQIAYLRGLVQINQQTMLACLNILKARESEYLVEAITTNVAWLQLIDEKMNEKELAFCQEKGGVSSSIITIENMANIASKLFAEADKATKKIKRQGFTAKTVLDNDKVYLQIIDLLQRMNNVFEALTALNKGSSKIDTSYIEAKYASDCSIVSDEFNRRYVM